jgi:hypothetical protein
MTTDWKEFLKPFEGKRCTSKEVGYCGEEFQPDVFDSDMHEKFVKSYMGNVIGSWAEAEKYFGVEPDSLVMFAANTLGDEVDAVLFYHRKTGEVFKYEGADFSDTDFKLDKLGLKAIGATPKGTL